MYCSCFYLGDIQHHSQMDYYLNSSDAAHFQCLFPPVHYVCLCIFDVTTAMVGLPLVFRHLWIALSTSPMDILNLNISIFSMVQCFFHLVDVILFTCLKRYYTEARYGMLWFSITGGPLFMSIICVERYIAVVWPRHYAILKTYKFREVCSAVSWAVTLFFSLAMIYAVIFKLASLSLVFYSAITVMCGATVFTIITCNLKILHALKKSGPGRDERHPIKVKAYQTVRRISVILLSCYFPSTVLSRFLQPIPGRPTTAQCIMIPSCLGLILTANIFYSFLTLHSKGKLCSCLKKSAAGTTV